MRKSYKGLSNALKTAENIIKSNKGIKWNELVNIFINDPFITDYYWEVIDILLSGRNSLRFEGKENDKF